MIEKIWKSVRGYEDLYKVSNLGVIKTIAHKTLGKDGYWVPVPSKIRKTQLANNGYLIITLCKNGKPKRYTLSRIVAEAFIPNPNNLPQVNHKDGNKLNNSVENLEWITGQDNIQHAWDTGLKIHPFGDINANYKGEIKAIDGSGKVVAIMRGVKNIKEFGFTPSAVYACLSGKLKTHKKHTFLRE